MQRCRLTWRHRECQSTAVAAVLACRLRFPVASAFCSCTPSLLSPLHSVSLSPPFDLRELNEDAYAMKAPTTNTLRLDLGLRRFVVVRRPSSSVVVVERRTSNIEHRPSKLRTFLPTSNERTIDRSNERTNIEEEQRRPSARNALSQSVSHSPTRTDSLLRSLYDPVNHFKGHSNTH